MLPRPGEFGPMATAPQFPPPLIPPTFTQYLDRTRTVVPPDFLLIMSLIFRRGIASIASLKKSSKVVCIGRNYASVVSRPLEDKQHMADLSV